MVSLESAKSHDLLTNQYKLSDEDPSVASGSSYATQDSGERKLAALGYTQELNRGFSTFTNFAVSFSIISILTGITGACQRLPSQLLIMVGTNNSSLACTTCPRTAVALGSLVYYQASRQINAERCSVFFSFLQLLLHSVHMNSGLCILKHLVVAQMSRDCLYTWGETDCDTNAGSYGIAFGNGGPVSAVWGWIVVAFMTSFVGLAMAEIVSALPSSGGPYFWASVLGGDKWGPLAAWVTGTALSYFFLSRVLCSLIWMMAMTGSACRPRVWTLVLLCG